MDVVDKADIYALGCLVYELHTSQMFIPEQKAAFQDNPEDDLTIVLDLNAKWVRTLFIKSRVNFVFIPYTRHAWETQTLWHSSSAPSRTAIRSDLTQDSF